METQYYAIQLKNATNLVVNRSNEEVSLNIVWENAVAHNKHCVIHCNGGKSILTSEIAFMRSLGNEEESKQFRYPLSKRNRL
ncbi:hypothetical protein BH780_gp171 [Bacillus phage Eldridge]|uniref:Uncharacterized protein n=1 Tax=Bacillus phage Eldridge TaxID=1776293 RepID=A0A0Y0ABG9_9CAUD|nr:hypothetical protein BH780_gp171 [Bacillus phage Eldridge]AMB18754.1 hypothetical protein Eldridge_0174 [Bacillus phage Eldridge]